MRDFRQLDGVQDRLNPQRLDSTLQGRDSLARPIPGSLIIYKCPKPECYESPRDGDGYVKSRCPNPYYCFCMEDLVVDGDGLRVETSNYLCKT